MKAYKRIVIILAVILLCFILANSFFSGSTSEYESLKIRELLYIILGNHSNWWRDFIFYNIRKIAHFVEFFFLGSVVFFFKFKEKKLRIQNFFNSLYFFFGISLLDETIQIFNDRTSRVSDMWIDIIGALSGMMLFILFNKMLRKHKDRKCKNDK